MARKTKYQRLTSEESLAKINPENARLSEDFLAYLRSTQRSETTIFAYRNDLAIAMVWIMRRRRNKCFVELTKRDIIAFQDWLINENGNSPARVRRIKSTLSSLSNYIESVEDDTYPDFRNIIHKIESPVAQPVRDKTIFSDEELQKLLDTLVEMRAYEKACALALAMYSGRRKSELIIFKTSYFTPDNIIFGSLYKTPEPIKTKGRGLGKFIHCYTLANKFQPYLDLWLQERERIGVVSEWLFPGAYDHSQHIKVDTLDRWAETFTRLSGRDFYWHSLRHYYTTSLVRAGLPDGVIQDIIGWSSADMLRLYTDISVDEQLGKYFDENGIKHVERASIGDL